MAADCERGGQAGAGGDRQDLHERIRRHSLAAAEQVKQHGRPNDLIDRLRSDPAFAEVDLATVLDPRRYVGRAPDWAGRATTAIALALPALTCSQAVAKLSQATLIWPEIRSCICWLEAR